MKEAPQESATAAAHAVGLPSAERDPEAPVFLRVGPWNPSDPRSRNYAAGDIEIGLSVYDLDEHGAPVVPPDGEWAEDDLRGEAPKFLVQGDVLGRGHDGEPLLGNPRVVGPYTPAARQFPSI